MARKSYIGYLTISDGWMFKFEKTLLEAKAVVKSKFKFYDETPGADYGDMVIYGLAFGEEPTALFGYSEVSHW